MIRIEAHDWLIFFLGAVCFRAYFRTWRLFWPSSVEELRSKGAIYIHIIDKMQRSTRMQRELSILTNEPPPGILCWMVDDQIDKLQAGFEMNSALVCIGTISVYKRCLLFKFANQLCHYTGSSSPHSPIAQGVRRPRKRGEGVGGGGTPPM